MASDSISFLCSQGKAEYTDDELDTPFKNGVTSPTDGVGYLEPNPKTGRANVEDLKAFVDKLRGVVVHATPTVQVGPDRETDIPELQKLDRKLQAKMIEEYCYYINRYKYALREFLKLATSRTEGNKDKAIAMLERTRLLNLRLNTVLEVMNYLAADRVGVVNSNKAAIDKLNTNINKNLEYLTRSYQYLSRENAVIRTQKEMVRYTLEKNNYTANQISTWAALNVLALATIFYVYRN